MSRDLIRKEEANLIEDKNQEQQNNKDILKEQRQQWMEMIPNDRNIKKII